MNQFFQYMVNEELVYEALKEVIDPELGLNVVDLGLIYEVEIDAGRIAITMTLTTPGCPLHATFSEQIEGVLRERIPGLEEVSVQLVWNPPWSPGLISEEGLEWLGLA